MRESDPVAVELEHPAFSGNLDVVDGGASERLKQCDRWRCECGDCDERFPDACRQRSQPVGHESAQALRQGHIVGVSPDRPVDDLAAELESEERIPACGLIDPDERGSRQREREPTPEKPVDRSDRQWLDRQPSELGEGAVEFEWRLDGSATRSRENTHRLVLKPPQHERQDIRGARIDPLHVIDRDENGPLLGERMHDRDERKPENTGLRRRPPGLPKEQRRLERASLERHEQRERLVHDRREQVTDRCERDPRLRRTRPRFEDTQAALVREAQSLLPQGRLADPRLALEQQRLTRVWNSLDERREREQLAGPTNHVICHGSPSLGPSRPVSNASRVPADGAQEQASSAHCAPVLLLAQAGKPARRAAAPVDPEGAVDQW